MPSSGNHNADILRRQIKYKNQDRHLGSGRHADVFSHKTRPDSVIKIVSLPDMRKDSTIAFIEYISQNGRAASNPYFPRVYNIRSYESEKGKDFIVMEMERLFPFSPHSVEEVLALGEQMFYDFEVGYRRIKRSHWNTQLSDKVSDPTLKVRYNEHDIEGISHYLINCLAAHLISASKTVNRFRNHIRKYSGMIVNIKDPKLKEAIMVLRGIMRSDIGGENDLTISNVMLRRGPTGAQLVFTDPIGTLY